ncbi:hypothetical protein BDZ97DRAFT_1918676 [Flammula alnicola]|nr:hypothetical protein BDZ97DRAFT_1918676 [Flammula alnicola]
MASLPVRQLPQRNSKNDRHPGAIVNETKRPRRNKAEIEADNAKKKEDDEQKAQAISQARKSAIQRSAEKEDAIQQQETNARKHANRPDLPTMAAYRQESHSDEEIDAVKDGDVTFYTSSPGHLLKPDILSAGEIDIDQEESFLTNDPSDLPPASSVGTDSEGDRSIGIDEFDNADYVGSGGSEMDTDEDWDRFLISRAASARKKLSKKEERERLRSQIDKERKHIPTSTIVAPNASGKQKRKAIEDIQQDAELRTAQTDKPKGKRTKAAEIGGLKPNWKKQAGLDPKTKSKASTAPIPRESSPDDVPGHDEDAAVDFNGEFAQDESSQVLAISRAAKTEVGPSRKRVADAKVGLKDLGTANLKMGVSLKKVKVDDSTSGSQATGRAQPKPRYKNSDLPLPNFKTDLKTWQTHILGAITDWAGTLDDPFHANSLEEFQVVVGENWEIAFGDAKLNDAVYDVAASSLRNWRSNIGKRALKFYAQKFSKAPFKNSPETIKSYVRDALSHLIVDGKNLGFKFIYTNPKAGSGAYRSDVIVDIFAVHLQIILKTDVSYGNPAGGLSLCCAAAERGLLAWETGYAPQPTDDSQDDKDGMKSFVENPWAARAAGYLPAVKTLSAAKWEKLIELAKATLKVREVTIDLTRKAEDPRSQVLLSEDSDAA